MPDFLITVHTDPPRSYVVEGVPSAETACAKLLALLGSDPGVEVDVIRTPLNVNPMEKFPCLSSS
ncbi:Uncharacterised protein [uncultured archaeon]|nr:Uncharacterised protein [uncultured archaeon]